MPPLQTLWRGLLYHNTHIMRTITHLLALALCVMSSSLQADTLPPCLDSKSFAAHWTIESESPDYRIQFLGDTLEVTSPKGMTIWRNERMEGRTIIEYDACLMDEGREGDRVSDLNCFWMASDPVVKDGSVFTRMKQRQGIFKNCYTLQLYYLGYGGNYNKTTRFRRYQGEANQGGESYPVPAILQEYTDEAHLNVPNQWRHIRIEADGTRIRYFIDGECLVDFRDPRPLTSGWFGVRTTWSRLRLTNFSCRTEPLSESPATGITLHWIERPTEDTIAVRFGVPFERGKVQPNDQFRLNDGDIECYPLAYWPDGSLKWAGFTGLATNAENYSLRQLSAQEIKAKKKGKQKNGTQPGLELCKTAEQYIIKNGDNLIFLPIGEGSNCMLDSLLYQGKVTCQRLRVCADEKDGRTDSVCIERQSGQQIVVKCCGTADGLPYIVRLYINAGSPTLRLVHSLIYNRNGKQPAPQSLCIRADVPLRQQAYNRHVAFTLDEGRLWHEPVQPVTGRRTLSLDGNGRGPEEMYHRQMLGKALPELEAFDDRNQGYLRDWATWDRFRLSQLLDEGFSIRKSAKPAPQTPWIGTLNGRRSTGGCFVGEVGRGLAMAMHDFWQSYPSTLLIEGATQPLATVSLYLWSPEAEPMDMRHYDTEAHGLEASYEDIQEGMSTPEGIGRTSTVMLRPTLGYPGDEALTSLFQTLTQEPQLICTPQYLHAQRAFGVWSLPDPMYANIEQQLTYWSDFYVNEVERRHWYGFWNYGDVMHAYDNERQEWRYDIGGFAWDNTELASNMMLWYNFLRTGRADLWRMAVAMTRHTSEVDVYHDGPFKGLGSRHNVSHWGCGSKEARISQALWNRFYYYLSGGDERLGELMSAQRDLDTLLYRIDPMRLAEPRGMYPCTAPARLRIGPDWMAYAANWMTEYERTQNPHYWTKMLNGMESISQMPLGIFSGPKALGYDPATGRLSWEGDPKMENTNHLLSLMGGTEFMGELLLIDEVPDAWRRTWLNYCTEYRQRAIKGKHNGYPMARLAAYAQWQSALEPTTVSRDELYQNTMVEYERGIQTPDRFSTNGISTWALDAIYMLEVCPPPLHKSEENSPQKH